MVTLGAFLMKKYAAARYVQHISHWLAMVMPYTPRAAACIA